MSTTKSSAPAHIAGGSLTFMGALRSEWIKFRSLRSTQLLLAFTFVAVVGVAAFAAWVRGMFVEGMMALGGAAGPTGPDTPPTGQTTMTMDQAIASANEQGLNVYGTPIAGLQLGILVLGALAVIFMASEFGTGMIRSTMTAVPKRLPVFFAKAIVLAVVSYVLTLAAAIVSFFVSMPLLNIYGIKLSLGMDGVLSSILLGGVYVAGVAVIGLSLGTLIRSAAGGVVVLVALFFLLEIATSLLSLIPGDFWKYVGQYVPSVAGGRMLEIGDKAAFISPLSGGLIFLAWIVVITVPAAISLKTRDI
ncbi:ABC transporter permease [Arthrobacter sp. H35-D1]|uniref:ABC transporter permease n=1 Tax=Arthrobacter sp. H35-D1 TaxID=3046202 RepID=UPI0024BA4011|nr:ABC transporter permease [Arthrobacter sp. H35-D1]MDJ0312101.1 ABC transporter permease [Arthrobacter sp. H35-D1]